MKDEVLKLSGKAASRFLKYDKRKLTATEKARNKNSHSYYLKHCKC